MTDPNPTALPAVLARRPTTAPHGPVAATETAQGPLILRDHSAPAGAAIFQDWQFELSEVAETLDLAKAARVYEEVVVHKTEQQRQERVTAVLRREEAEIKLEGQIDGITTPRPGRPLP